MMCKSHRRARAHDCAFYNFYRTYPNNPLRVPAAPFCLEDAVVVVVVNGVDIQLIILKDDQSSINPPAISLAEDCSLEDCWN
jgi:hypothetical protein